MSRQPPTMPRIGTSTVAAPSRTPRAQTPTDKLTLAQLCAELQIARSTFYDWRVKGTAPRCIKLPNGDLRIRRQDLDQWLDDHEESSVG